MGIKKWQKYQCQYFQGFFLKPGGRYKRTGRRPKGRPIEEHYTLQAEKLDELEQMDREGKTDLYNGDETHVCSQGYVSYGWQFPDEEVCIFSEKAYKINCSGFINRQNTCRRKTAESNIDTQSVLEYPEEFSFQTGRTTFAVLDNACVHRAKIIQEHIPYWQKRGLHIFFLPRYSPHLNIAETMWRKLKKEWLNPEDYIYMDSFFYAVNRCIAGLGHSLMIVLSILRSCFEFIQ